MDLYLAGEVSKSFCKEKRQFEKYYSTRVKLAFNPCNTSRLTICIRRSPSNWEKIGKKIARREGNSSESGRNGKPIKQSIEETASTSPRPRFIEKIGKLNERQKSVAE